MAMDLSGATSELREAASITVSHNGEAVHEQLGAACEMVAFLSDYEWRIWYYSEKTTNGVPLLIVRVNALSGRVTLGH